MKYDDDPLPTAPTAAAPTVPRQRRRPWQRTGFWFLLAILGCLVYLGGSYYHRHAQSTDAVRQAVNKLDRTEPGWRLDDLEAARAAVSDDANSALRVQAADGLLHRGSYEANLRLRLQALAPNERPQPADVARLRAELAVEQPALDKARELADLPDGRFATVRQRNLFLMGWPQLQGVENVSTLLGHDALLQAEDGDLHAAARACRARLNAARSLGDDPDLLGQLVRMARVHEACASIERVLNQGELDPDDLADLQRRLENEERFQRLTVLLRGERARVQEMLDGLESGDVPLDDLNRQAENHFPPLDSVYTKDAVRAAHPEMLARLTEAVAIGQLPAHQRKERIAAYEDSLSAELKGSALYLLLPNLRWVNATVRRADARLRCLVAALAVERYRRARGRWPDALDDLTPDLLAAVPTDPANGEPLGYRLYSDRVVVYSRLVVARGPSAPVGPPMAFTPDQPSVPGIGPAVHLFNLVYRRQQERGHIDWLLRPILIPRTLP